MNRIPTMSLRRMTGLLVASVTAANATLALATPAQAATINVTATCSGGGVVVANDYVTAGVGDIIFLQNATGVTVTLANKSGVTGSASLNNANATNLTVTAASGSFDIVGAAGCNAFAATVTFGASRAAPTIDLDLRALTGDACNVPSVSGALGSWIALPQGSDCTPPPTTPNAALLGWATRADFPIAIAKRQVDNGWGAYEIFDADGRLTAVFIPVGRQTQLNAEGNLFPIWNQ